MTGITVATIVACTLLFVATEMNFVVAHPAAHHDGLRHQQHQRLHQRNKQNSTYLQNNVEGSLLDGIFEVEEKTYLASLREKRQFNNYDYLIEEMQNKSVCPYRMKNITNSKLRDHLSVEMYHIMCEDDKGSPCNHYTAGDNQKEVPCCLQTYRLINIMVNQTAVQERLFTGCICAFRGTPLNEVDKLNIYQ